jgi:hypothetical protein
LKGQGNEHKVSQQKVVTGMTYKMHQHFKKNLGMNMMPFVIMVTMMAQTNSMSHTLPAVKAKMMQNVRKCLYCEKISAIMSCLLTYLSWLK